MNDSTQQEAEWTIPEPDPVIWRMHQAEEAAREADIRGICKVFGMTRDEYIRMHVEGRLQDERKPFAPHWDEIVSKVRGRQFRTRKEIAEKYGKSNDWVRRLLNLMCKQDVMTRDELRAAFSGWRQTPRRYDPSLTATRTPKGGMPPLSREQFEKVFKDKQDCLSWDLALRLLRLGAWASPGQFAACFRQPTPWAYSLRTLLLRERLFTAHDWRDCFKKTNWSRITRKYKTATSDITTTTNQ